jgi:hypothetical protein
VKKRSLFAIALALAVAAVTGAGAARADLLYGSGASCTPAFGSQSYVGTGEPGIGNYVSYADARVFCPISRDPVDPNPQLHVIESYINYYDGSNSQPMWCYGFATNGYNTYWSGSKYTCTGSGCIDYTTAFTGSGYLYWSYPFGGWFIANAFYTFGASCQIPRAGTPGTSWLTNYDFNMH